MPIRMRSDKKGEYYQWGNNGKKYYFYDDKTQEIAYNNSLRQARAAYSHGYHKK